MEEFNFKDVAEMMRSEALLSQQEKTDRIRALLESDELEEYMDNNSEFEISVNIPAF